MRVSVASPWNVPRRGAPRETQPSVGLLSESHRAEKSSNKPTRCRADWAPVIRNKWLRGHQRGRRARPRIHPERAIRDRVDWTSRLDDRGSFAHIRTEPKSKSLFGLNGPFDRDDRNGHEGAGESRGANENFWRSASKHFFHQTKIARVLIGSASAAFVPRVRGSRSTRRTRRLPHAPPSPPRSPLDVATRALEPPSLAPRVGSRRRGAHPPRRAQPAGPRPSRSTDVVRHRLVEAVVDGVAQAVLLHGGVVGELAARRM